MVIADKQEPDGLKTIDLGAGHSSGSETLCGRVITALKSQALLNESVGAGYIERNWPPALKDSGAWPLSSLRQSFLNGSLTRLLDPDTILRGKIVELVSRGDFGLASGREPDGGYERVLFNEVTDPADVTRESSEKAAWSGRVVAVQPRIRLTRSFDERSHSYLGYVLHIDGICGRDAGEFLIAVGEVAHEKHRFQTGMEIQGQSVHVDDPRKETAALYKTSGIKVVKNAEDKPSAGPPFRGVPPDLETYRSRGHRRLDARTYDTKCTPCIWGCRMPVEIIIDQWNPSKKQYRFETFCYGPKGCPFYRPGPARKVPGRKGMSYTEDDWVDEDATAHRGPDE